MDSTASVRMVEKGVEATGDGGQGAGGGGRCGGGAARWVAGFANSRQRRPKKRGEVLVGR